MLDVSLISMRSTNARIHSDVQIAQIARSIREFGFVNPVLVDGDYRLIAGHGRLGAAMRIGMDKVPAIILSDLTEDQCRALVIADNKIALNAGWDPGTLLSEIEAIAADGLVPVDVLGFDEAELQALRDGGSVEPQPDPGVESKGLDDPRVSFRVFVDRADEVDARDVVSRALEAAGLTYDVK
jgi:ParB-like chromosome segregation protein Spo0J